MVTDEMKEEIRRFLEFSENERSQINDLMLHTKLLGKQEETNPKTNRGEIIKIRAKINEIETNKKKYKESMKQKLSSLKK
jgi:hypothetical protein